MDDGFVYYEGTAYVRERRSGRLRYESDAASREVVFEFVLDRFEETVGDTLRLDPTRGEEVVLVPGKGVVRLGGSHYYGLGVTYSLRAER